MLALLIPTCVIRIIHTAQVLCQPKIGEQLVAIGGQQDILRFDIAAQDSAALQKIEHDQQLGGVEPGVLL